MDRGGEPPGIVQECGQDSAVGIPKAVFEPGIVGQVENGLVVFVKRKFHPEGRLDRRLGKESHQFFTPFLPVDHKCLFTPGAILFR